MRKQIICKTYGYEFAWSFEPAEMFQFFLSR
jgi:hypothetical protein